MKIKILPIALLYLFFLASPPLYSQNVVLFKEVLEPATEELKEILNKTKCFDEEREKLLEELQNKAYTEGASQDAKTDYAAFLLRKVIIQRNQPIENNEPLLNEVYDLLPGDFYLETLWGDLLYASGDYENCLTHYENALNKRPDDIDITGKAGLANMNILHYEKAIEYIEVFLAKYPDSFYFLYANGRCNFELNNYEEAVEYFEKSLEFCQDENNRKAIEELIAKAKEALASTDGSTKDEDQRFVLTFAGNSKDDLGDITFDILDEIYGEVTSLININPDVKINVVFFLTEDYYKQSGMDWSAGAAQGIQIMIPLKSGYKDPEYVKGLLAHEFTHTMINLKTNNRCPLWLHEGLAQYQEYTTSYGAPENLRSDFENVYQTDFVENELFIPISKISSQIHSGDNRSIAQGYVAAYMAIRCLAEFYGEQSFDTILSAIGRGKSESEAIEEATGDLTFKKQIKSDDEIGQINDSFNELVHNLKNIILKQKENDT